MPAHTVLAGVLAAALLQRVGQEAQGNTESGHRKLSISKRKLPKEVGGRCSWVQESGPGSTVSDKIETA